MPKATGQVAKKYARDGKYGKMWSFLLEGDETWYGTKGVEPPVQEGDTVEFNWANNKRGYPDADLESIVVLEAGAAPAATTQAAPKSSGAGAYDRKQAVIVYQSSRKDALELIHLALNADILDLGTGKATVADKYATLRTFVDLATNDFYHDAMEVFGGKTPGEEE